MPVRTFSAVDLPEPLWPMMPSEDPFGTAKDASLRAQNVLGAGARPRTNRSLRDVRRSVAMRNFLERATASTAISVISPRPRPCPTCGKRTPQSTTDASVQAPQ